MYPLPTASSLPKYKLQEYKSLVQAMEADTRPDEASLYQLGQKTPLTSYQGQRWVTQFRPLHVVRDLINELEHTQAHHERLLVRRENALFQAASRIADLMAEVEHLKSLAFPEPSPFDDILQ